MSLRAKKSLFIVVLLSIFFLPTKIFGDQATDHFNKGHRFYLDSKPEQSEVEFREALQLNPKLSDAHYYLGSIYFKQDRYPQAIAECRKAIVLNPEDVKSLIILGLSFQQMELFDQAISAFQAAAEIDAHSAAAHSALGLACCANGDIARAKEEYNLLKQIDVELAEDLLDQIRDLSSKSKELH